jgi:hypothetical protein
VLYSKIPLEHPLPPPQVAKNSIVLKKLRVNSFTPRLNKRLRKKAGLQQPNTPKATPMGTRTTRIQRISADQIHVHPPDKDAINRLSTTQKPDLS